MARRMSTPPASPYAEETDYDANLQAHLGAVLHQYLPTSPRPQNFDVLDALCYLALRSPDDPPAALAFQIRSNRQPSIARLVLTGGAPDAAEHLAAIWGMLAEVANMPDGEESRSRAETLQEFVCEYSRDAIEDAFIQHWDVLSDAARAVQRAVPSPHTGSLAERFLMTFIDLHRAARMLKGCVEWDTQMFGATMGSAGHFARLLAREGGWRAAEQGGLSVIAEVREAVEALTVIPMAAFTLWVLSTTPQRRGLFPVNPEHRSVVVVPNALPTPLRAGVWQLPGDVARAATAAEAHPGEVHAVTTMAKWLHQHRLSLGGWPTASYIGSAPFEPCVPCRAVVNAVREFGPNWCLRRYESAGGSWRIGWRMPVWGETEADEEEAKILANDVGSLLDERTSKMMKRFYRATEYED